MVAATQEMEEIQEGPYVKSTTQVLNTASDADLVELRAKDRTRNLVYAQSRRDHTESMDPDARTSPRGRATLIEATGKAANSLSRRFVNRR
jgi:hypothetical protein